MATSGEIFAGEWEVDEELYTSLSQYIAEALEQQPRQSECSNLASASDWGGLLDLFGASVPALITQLLAANEGEEAGSQSSTIDGIVSVLVGLCLKVKENDRTAKWTKLAQMVIDCTGEVVATSFAKARLQLLLDVFNSIQHTAHQALHSVFCLVIDFVAANEMIDQLSCRLPAMEGPIDSWALKQSDLRSLYVKLARALRGAGEQYQLMTFKFICKYLALFAVADKDTTSAFPLAVEAAVLAIQDPMQHDCNHLLSLPPVAAMEKAGGKEASAHRLLQIFGGEKLESYNQFVQQNSSAVAELGLDHEVCTNKMRLLSLANLATENAEIPYSTIADALAIEASDVEAWVIKASRAELIKARMDQLRQVVVVSRTKFRVLQANDWSMLGNQVGTWKNSLSHLQSLLLQARQANN